VSQMSSRVRSSVVPAARLLTRAQAAMYCGLGVSAFSAICPVRPISMGPDKRLERYDVVELNKWIDRLSAGSAATGTNWLAAMGNTDDCGAG
jgi:hypothetical protein